MSTTQDLLDRALLDRVEPPCHQAAREELAKAGIKAKKIIAVRPEAIIYLAPSGKVCTAWSELREGTGAVVFYCQPGMPAWPDN